MDWSTGILGAMLNKKTATSISAIFGQEKLGNQISQLFAAAIPQQTEAFKEMILAAPKFTQEILRYREMSKAL